MVPEKAIERRVYYNIRRWVQVALAGEGRCKIIYYWRAEMDIIDMKVDESHQGNQPASRRHFQDRRWIDTGLYCLRYVPKDGEDGKTALLWD